MLIILFLNSLFIIKSGIKRHSQTEFGTVFFATEYTRKTSINFIFSIKI